MRKRSSITQILLFAAFWVLAAGCSKEELKGSEVPAEVSEPQKGPEVPAEISEGPKSSEVPTEASESQTASDISAEASKPQTASDIFAESSETEEPEFKETEHIAELCQEIYKKAAETNTSGALENMQSIVAWLGEQGYAAVDSENQINMTNAEQVLEFCKAVEKQEPAEQTILVAADYGLRKFDLKTEEGKINIVREYCQYDDNGVLINIDTASYPADRWQFTKEGYLIFEGKYFSAVDYVLTLSDKPEYAVLRVLPLDETCREWNRKYILPVGYGRNNIFLSDWSQEDFGALELYDVFDVFYPELYQRPVPYAADENLNTGKVYQIPEDEFETVILSHFNIGLEAIRAKTTYFPEDGAYEYRPRGFYEVDYSDIPYPEVVSYTNNEDGTVTLVVNAVYPDGKTSKLFSHKTVIRPGKDEDSQNGSTAVFQNNNVGISYGQKGEEANSRENSPMAGENSPIAGEDFQYVSNRVISFFGADETKVQQEGISAENDNSFWWHAERLTKEQWEKIYGGKE